MKTMLPKRFVLIIMGLMAYTLTQAAERFVSFKQGDWQLNAHDSVMVFVERDAPKGVHRAAGDLCTDITKVCGGKVKITTDAQNAQIIIRTRPNGKWEEYLVDCQDGQLTITGSDRRGTIYGIYELSRQLGVSPWYWWADVPVAHHDKIFLKKGRYTDGEPKVKYRGIFINDERPSFVGWSEKHFGDVNSKMYAHLFELILRLKANYFWPAMWGNAFNEDDPMNPVVADEYGVVMGTSHHEPMMRAHQEYLRRKNEVGPWDYVTNKERVNKFFREGMEHAKDFDNVVTIGMRGDGDVAMGKGNDDDNINTLKDVVANQRRIIEEVTGKKASEVPQLWAIFTEVQRYYDRGLTVPDDVIKVFCDNNWGYIRRTGPEKEKNADGSWKPMGLYYHIDMNGGPWNDRWINTTTIPKLQNQLRLAYDTGLDDLWIINVGDLKPKEVPIDFIMQLAWNPEAVDIEDCHRYMVDFANSCFGKEHAEDIARLIETYSKYNLWRKPESESTAIYSVENYHEADRMIERWNRLVEQADSIKALIPSSQQDAFYQLAYYPAVASAYVGLTYLYATKAQIYSAQGRPEANRYMKLEQQTYALDKALQEYYNHHLAHGKWEGMMQDIHFGYKQWFMPQQDSIPECNPMTLSDAPLLRVALEGGKAETLPTFDVLDNQTYYIDVFNHGKGQLPAYKVRHPKWVQLESENVADGTAARINVRIDWNKLKEGEQEGVILIKSGKQKFDIALCAVKHPIPNSTKPYYGSMSGKEFSFPANALTLRDGFRFLPGLGRDEGVVAPSPTGAGRGEVALYFPTAGKQTILVGILPTQDIKPERGLHFSIAFDNGAPKRVDARKGLVDTFMEYTPQALAKQSVLKPVEQANRNIKMVVGNWYCRNEVHDNIRWIDVTLDIASPGMHTLKITDADPEIMFERFVVNPDNDHYSYFGAPTIVHQPNDNTTTK